MLAGTVAGVVRVVAAFWHNDSFQSVYLLCAKTVRNYKIALNLVLVGNLNRLVEKSDSSSSAFLPLIIVGK